MAPHAEVNGLPLLSLRLCLPRTGLWHGELTAESEDVLDYAIAFSIGGVGFSGTARTTAVTAGTAVASFVAGAGGLQKAAAPKSYRDVELSVVLQDILNSSGETLASSASRSVTGLKLAAWTVVAGKCGSALNALINLGARDALEDAVWRALPDGTLYVGEEGWVSADIEHQVLQEDPMAARLVAYMETPSLLPGTEFRDRHVSYVEHILKDSTLRTHVWFEK
ncbi:MAG: hypothetical protein ABW123_11580 [Cystobacter sp.]